ncbi:hypothetical protein [Adhaeribacter soli]|nr:hypothetical protein [Adhaeribacter soli]
MKQILFNFIFLSLTLEGFSQSLTLNELLKFQASAPEEINRILEKKNWQCVSVDEPTPELLGKTVWAYKPKPENGTAAAWCILYQGASTPNRILYNPTDGNVLAAIRKKVLKRKGIDPLDLKPEPLPEYVKAVDAFSDGEYIFLFQTYVQPGYGGIKIFRKADYLKALQN